jgi:hypothetical protein
MDIHTAYLVLGLDIDTATEYDVKLAFNTLVIQQPWISGTLNTAYMTIMYKSLLMRG